MLKHWYFLILGIFTLSFLSLLSANYWDDTYYEYVLDNGDQFEITLYNDEYPEGLLTSEISVSPEGFYMPKLFGYQVVYFQGKYLSEVADDFTERFSKLRGEDVQAAFRIISLRRDKQLTLKIGTEDQRKLMWTPDIKLKDYLDMYRPDVPYSQQVKVLRGKEIISFYIDERNEIMNSFEFSIQQGDKIVVLDPEQIHFSGEIAKRELALSFKNPLYTKGTVSDYLKDSGGFTPDASGKVIITRITPAGDTKTFTLYFDIKTLEPKNSFSEEFILMPGDTAYAERSWTWFLP